MGNTTKNTGSYVGSFSAEDERTIDLALAQAEAEELLSRPVPGVDLFGLASGAVRASRANNPLPWMRTSGQGPKKFFGKENEVFFTPFAIDPSRWNKMFPYRLLVIDATTNKVVTAKDGENNSVSVQYTNIVKSNGQADYLITQEAVPGAWEMVFPITPQQLQITDQFAINTSATMRGVVEEHNGVKFKMITASGTTGIWPKRPSEGGKIAPKTAVASIFGGTLAGIQNITEQASSIKSAIDGKHPNRQPSEQVPGDTGVGTEFSTGYYQALYLGQFLERYAQAKKHPDWKNMRLVLDMPKQNQAFVVTPVQFTLNQSEQRPGEYLFTIQLKAWKRIKLDTEIEPASSTLPNLSDPNAYQRFVNAIEGTRRTLGESINLVKAVRSDFQGVFNNLRQLSLVVKDAGDFVYSAIDLPRNIIADAQSTIEDSITNTLEAFLPPTSRFRDQAGLDGVTNKFLGTGGEVAQSISNKRAAHEGLSRQAVKDGALGLEAAQRTETDVINNIFAEPESSFDLFNEVSVEDLNLNEKQRLAFEDEIENSRFTTVQDLRDIRSDLAELSRQISDNYGAGDETYSDIYGLPAPKERTLPLSVEENEIMSSIFETIQVLDLLTATKQFDDLRSEDSLEFVGGLANESGIDFQEFPSKIPVPVPFGATIEEIAARYMGDADRWVEIVTVNKLRSPYIDEVGFIYSFLSNADGRQFTVNDPDERLFIGQSLVLSSSTVPAFSRKITDIKDIGLDNYLITVDGEANLEALATADGAQMQAYLPGTVNSQNQIYIPVDLPSEDDDRTFDIPNIDANGLTKVSKIDFLLTDNFDLAINSVGDFRLANGLTNLIQALKLKIRTQKGSILRHLNYGLGITHGVSVADIENGELINQLNRMIDEDPRFQAITRLDLRLTGSTLGIDMVVQLANNTGVVPINFDIKVS